MVVCCVNNVQAGFTDPIYLFDVSRYSPRPRLRTQMAKKNKTIRSVAFVSLGCPKNLVDSERMLGLLAQDGLTITADASQADAIVINTCGFLEASKTESLAEIREAIELKKTGKCQRVIVAGCLVQRHKTKLLNDVPADRPAGRRVRSRAHRRSRPRQGKSPAGAWAFSGEVS